MVITIEKIVIPKDIIDNVTVSDSGCLNLIKNMSAVNIRMIRGTKSFTCSVTK